MCCVYMVNFVIVVFILAYSLYTLYNINPQGPWPNVCQITDNTSLFPLPYLTSHLPYILVYIVLMFIERAHACPGRGGWRLPRGPSRPKLLGSEVGVDPSVAILICLRILTARLDFGR